MHIYLKQEFGSFNDTYFAYTNAEEQRYSITDSSFLPWHKIKIVRNESTVGEIKQMFFGLKPHYMLHDIDDHQAYELRRIGSVEEGMYSIAGTDWHVAGNIVGMNFAIIDQIGTQIASVSIRDTPIGHAIDIYIVNILDEILALMAIIAVICDRKDQKSKSQNPENYV